MNRVDRDDTAFAQTAEGRKDNIAAGRERDRPIKLLRRFFRFCSHPGCAERLCQLSMRFAAGRDIDLAIPVLKDCDGEMSGGAEAEESNSISVFDASDANTAKTDDARTEQRGSLHVIERRG